MKAQGASTAKRAMETAPRTPSPRKRRRVRARQTTAGSAAPVEPAQQQNPPVGGDHHDSEATETEVSATPEVDEPEAEVSQESAQTPERDDGLSVITSDASPHDSMFEFLHLHAADGDACGSSVFSLFTPSPHRAPHAPRTVTATAGVSPPLSRGSSAACSPSRFFRSPLVSTRSSSRTSSRTGIRSENSANRGQSFTPIRLATPSRLLEAIDSLSQQQEATGMATNAGQVRFKEERTGAAAQAKKSSERQTELHVKHEPLRDEDLVVPSLLSPWQQPKGESKAAAAATVELQTPSPASRQWQLSRRLKDLFDRTDDDNGSEDAARATGTTGGRRSNEDVTLLDADDLRSAPSGLTSTLADQDSFFSFANSLSPLVPAEDLDVNFLSLRFSPMASLSSYELPRLMPPFPEPHSEDSREKKRATEATENTPSVLKTPTVQSRTSRSSSAGSLAGGGIPGSASASSQSSLASPSLSRFLNEAFPNIQASTSATPGKDERSKLGSHSIMRLKLHTSFEPSASSEFGAHSTREIRAINNSLKRKKYIRRRKLEDKRGHTKASSAATSVQRKLLQTPVKASSTPRVRSPLHPLNGRMPRVNLSEAATADKPVAPSPARPTTPAKHGVNASPVAIAAAASSFSVSPAVARQSVAPTSALGANTTSSPILGAVSRKRKAPRTPVACSSTPAYTTLKMRKSSLSSAQPTVPMTPTKIKTEVMATPPGNAKRARALKKVPGRAGGISPMDANMLKTPTSLVSSSSLSMSLQSASKAPLVSGVPATAPMMKARKAPCNCKKSKCLKLYCECFASGGYCDESCNCLDCANTPATEEVRQQAIAARLEKNPNAFKPKIGAAKAVLTVTPGGARRLSLSTVGSGSDDASSSFLRPLGAQRLHPQQLISGGSVVTTKMHKHGCHCKKSACQKKYCECFQAGVPCGDNCRCIDCKNQAPCVAHATDATGAAAAVAATNSAVGGTPSRIASEIDETFVSPVLQGVRQRLRIDRETWTKNFSSPFETSPGRERERKERFRSRLRASPRLGRSSITSGASSLSVRLRNVPLASPSTPQVTMGRLKTKEPRGLSPLMGSAEAERDHGDRSALVDTTTLNVRVLKERELWRRSMEQKLCESGHRAALSALTHSSAGAEKVFVLPLFGLELPPMESGVSALIFRFLTNADLHNASLVNRLWSQVALGATVWDHANLVPTEANVASASRRQRGKSHILETPIKREPDPTQLATRITR